MHFETATGDSQSRTAAHGTPTAAFTARGSGSSHTRAEAMPASFKAPLWTWPVSSGRLVAPAGLPWTIERRRCISGGAVFVFVFFYQNLLDAVPEATASVS
mmetsp:Transcript_1825/g.3060  ORF Transcript_1825/g.3060 Transcript_1825/m.3060 type:complete len:101 (+) Transcript_1825:1086-1388(+)